MAVPLRAMAMVAPVDARADADRADVGARSDTAAAGARAGADRANVDASSDFGTGGARAKEGKCEHGCN